MDWHELRQEPSNDAGEVAARRAKWLKAAEETAREEAEEAAEEAEEAIEAGKEAAEEIKAALALMEFSKGREMEEKLLTGPPAFEEADNKSTEELMLRYNIIDHITIKNIENDTIVNDCNLLTEAIIALLDESYARIDLKKNGGTPNVGWEYIYIVCELILNTEYFYSLIKNGVFDYGLFIHFYDSMYTYISSTISNHTYPDHDMYILGIIIHFNRLFEAHPQGGQIKYEFIMKIAHRLPISFLFHNPVEKEFPILLRDIIVVRPLIPKCLQSFNTELMSLMSCSNSSRSHIEGQLVKTPCAHFSKENINVCNRDIASLTGGSYKNNILKKLKVKKRATKRRQHKSQKHKNRKKHKSQKQKNLRKYKSKNQRKYKSIFNKTLKRKI